MTIVTVMTTIYPPEERIVTTVITVTAEGIWEQENPSKYIPKSAKNPE